MQGKLGDHDSEIDVNRSSHTSWAFTLRKTSTRKRQPTKADYNLHICKLAISTKSILKDFCFEETGGLHMHGVIEVDKDVPMYKFRVRGWKFHFEEIWSYDGWKRYMAKEQILALSEEFIDEELPAMCLRKSLFKDRNNAPAIASNDAIASLPDTII